MTQRTHHMPFGTQILDDGQVRFNLWAPHAERVDLRFENCGSYLHIPMHAEGDWFTLTTREARPASLYHFIINGDVAVPDPASRYQPQDVHGPSQLIDPCQWVWTDQSWQGRRWAEAVIYELHVGTFTPEGNFSGVCERLDYLVNLGITAIQLMPLADFPGRWNWGYDGALLYAPDSRYGTPDELKALIQGAHSKGLMVFLDVVYNHFGPEGNYLHTYNQSFFSRDEHTPWGAAINICGEDSQWVRQFFIHNALYWLEEYHFDGLRLDAVDAILDRSVPHILNELAHKVHQTLGNNRQIHLILENDNNSADLLKRSPEGQSVLYDAQWNDDIHHALHVLLTGEQGGCYSDFVDHPLRHVGRCLADGFAYQGEQSCYRDGRPRGESSIHLPPAAFVSFLQNHDQIGNRPLGDRISDLQIEHRRLRAVITILLLAPSPPMLFMGEEWAASTPFPFFCDFSPSLAENIITGRLEGFSRFPEFSSPDVAARVPNPVAEETFASAVLHWSEQAGLEHNDWLTFYRKLIELRHTEIIPCLGLLSGIQSHYHLPTEYVLSVEWVLAKDVRLNLLANFGDEPFLKVKNPPGRLLFSSAFDANEALLKGKLPGWTSVWFIEN